MSEARAADPERPERRAPKHAPRTPFLLLLVGLFGGGMVLLLVLNTASAANEVARHDVATRGARAAAQLQDLRNRIADSAAPANLAAAAAQLGMVPAGNPAFLVIGPNGQVSVMGRPGAASEPPVAQPKSPKPRTSTTPAAAQTTRPKTGAATTTSSKPTAGAHPSPAKAPVPTPTPTPTLTIGGGDR